MSSGRALSFALSLICLLLLASCGGAITTPAASTLPRLTAAAPKEPTPTSSGEVVVFAASSLTDAFRAMQDGLQSAGIDGASYNFGGSQALAAQLRLGAKADVFASADLQSMDAATASGAVVSGTQKVLTTNGLVVAVPPGDNGKVAALKDLAKPGIKLDLAGPTVPVGNYSLQVLDKLAADASYGADFKQRVLDNVVSREDNVRQVLAKVQVGEADAGMVYATDAAAANASASGSRIRVIEIPDQYNVIARYYIAPIKDAAHQQSAQRFIQYALSDEGQAALEKYGFKHDDSSK